MFILLACMRHDNIRAVEKPIGTYQRQLSLEEIAERRKARQALADHAYNHGYAEPNYRTRLMASDHQRARVYAPPLDAGDE
jgi:hypothetical protein